MPTVALVGAGGLVGALVAAELVDRGMEVVAVGRDTGRIASALAEARVTPAGVRRADASDPRALTVAIDGCSAVVDAVAPMSPVGRTVAEVACAAGIPAIDVGAEQTHVRAIHDLDAAAHEAGVVLVPGGGLQHTIGDLLAHLAGTAVDVAGEVHVAYTLPDRSGVLAQASAGRRRSVAAELGVPAVARQHGQDVEERAGEARRLAWFPRPVGPSHAAGIPAGEALSVPRHLPGVQGVRTYLAVPGWRAELLQAVDNAARWDPAGRWLRRRLERDRPPLGTTRRAGIRWACVAEASGFEGVAGVARAWAYGHDPYRVTAVVAVALLVEVLEGERRSGVLAPSEVAAPTVLLDRIAQRTDLRWSISRPEHG